MTIDLKKITKGRQTRPPRVLVYGFESVGKSSFAAGAASPFFLDADRGSHKLDVARYLPESWTEFREWLTAIEKGQVPCETVVLDSVTALEAMLHAEIFQGTTIEAFDGGYGRGETYALNHWREVGAQLERLWYQGKGIVLVAHAVVKTFSDPSSTPYDRFEVSARPKVAAFLRQLLCDYVLFCREDVLPVPGKNTKRATTTGARWAYTRRCPAYDAKARGTLMFPERIPLSWDSFVGEIAKDETRGAELRAEIDAMLGEMADKTLAEQVSAYLKANPERVLEARTRVAARLEEFRKKNQEQPATA